MAVVEFWIQIENREWDASPNRFDRMTGEDFFPGSVLKTLTSPVTGVVRNNVRMYKPLGQEALILRRYTANWAAPDDRKINPWDLNEPNPTDSGTMGTIPGPVIECNVGDTVKVHFRNLDGRVGKDIKARTHSLHPHGFVFANTSDGAYPLSPPDLAQPIPAAEQAAWAAIGVTGPNKMGDRVPPGGTFTYTWETFGWPTTAGVWLYHDHSICDMQNVRLGAIGIIVIHNPTDTNNDFLITPADLPNGSFTDSPVVVTCFPFPRPVPVLPLDLVDLRSVTAEHGRSQHHGNINAAKKKGHEGEKVGAEGPTIGPPVAERLIQRGDLMFELDLQLKAINRLCIPTYRTPPEKEIILQLFHELTGAPGMSINGRTFLGNTPTIVTGVSTKMRFGVVGMGDVIHTFHLHGHRWIIPGPHGNTPIAIQGSQQDTPVSQFEDTRIFGPANSFVFTIDEAAGGFMRAGGPVPDQAKGEWHMHCHVLGHMMTGMMGSLLIVGDGDFAGPLPKGFPCPPDITGGGIVPVSINDNFFSPANVMISAGQTVRWTNNGSAHTASGNKSSGQNFICVPVSTEVFDSGILTTGNTFDHTFNTPGTYAYHCEVHGCPMAGTVMVM